MIRMRLRRNGTCKNGVIQAALSYIPRRVGDTADVSAGELEKIPFPTSEIIMRN